MIMDLAERTRVAPQRASRRPRTPSSPQPHALDARLPPPRHPGQNALAAALAQFDAAAEHSRSTRAARRPARSRSARSRSTSR